MEKVTTRFYRPYIRKTIKRVIKQCEVCQKVKNVNYNKQTEVLRIRTTQPNELITTDFAGPFKCTIRGNKYFQIIMDHGSKVLELAPTKNTKANTAAGNIVDVWCCRYGIPWGVLSDQGTGYQSKLMDLVYDHLDIKRLKTTPYHPQCDGQSEKTVQTIKDMIRCYVDENQQSWDLNFQKYAFAYNSSLHAITQQTPFEMMFGRKPRIPIDILFPNLNLLNREPIRDSTTITNELGEVEILPDYEPDETKIPEEAKSYVENLKHHLKESFRIAQTNTNVKVDKTKLDTERKLKKANYKIGDLVLANHPKLKKGLSQGIARKYYGPFEIVGINPNGVDYFMNQVLTKNQDTT